MAQPLLSGKVLSEDGRSVSFASVKWKIQADAIVQAYAIADEKGNYELTLPAGLTGFVEVSAIGYKTIVLHLAEMKASSGQLTITLPVQTAELKTVTVRNKPSVRVSGDTTAYLVDKFKRGNESNVNELLANIPGFTVGRSGIITYNGKVIDRVIINGDDLTGKNYRYLTRNLDPAGIEEMQVIRNYSDPTSITASLTSGNEQALNIVYKRGWLHRIFGVADAAAGLPATAYNGGVQALGLFNKVKGLFIQRANNIGQTTLNPGASMLPEDLQIDPVFDIPAVQYKPLTSITDINTGMQDVTALTENNTASSMLTFLIKPVKTLSLRGRLDFSYDRYRQFMNNTVTYVTASPPIDIVQQNDIKRRLQTLKGTLLMNYYLPKGRDQLLLLLKGAAENNKSTSGNIIAEDEKLENLSEEDKQTGIRLIYNHLFRKQASFSSQVSYMEGRLPLTYRISPAAFNSFFMPADPFSDLNQQSRQYYQNFSGQLAALKKYERHTLSCTLSTSLKKEELSNAISHTTPTHEDFISSDSVNSLGNKLTTVSNTLQDTWFFNKNAAATISATLFYYENNLSNHTGVANSHSINGMRLLPAFSLNYKLGRYSQLNFALNQDNRFAESSVLGQGYVIRNLYTVSRNLNLLQQRLSRSANLSFVSNNIADRKRLFYSFLSFSQMPLFYIPKVQAHPDFTFMEYVPSQKTTRMLILRVSGQKLSKNFRQKIAPGISIIQGHNYRVENDMEKKTKFLQVQGNIGFDKEVGRIQLRTSLEYNIFYQTFVRSTYNQYWTASLYANWKLTDNFFLDGRATYFIVKPYHQPAADFANTEAGILIQTKNNKWNFGLRGTNLNNQTNYTTAVFSPISTSLTSYLLFPRIVLVSVKYKF
jgi:hypothetical protein